MNQIQTKSKRTQNLISIAIVFTGIFFIAFITIVVTTNKMSPGNAEWKDSINIFLPVISAWVGTILAFYFGKESYDAANERVKEIIDKINPVEKLKNISIKDAMIKFDKIIRYDLPDGKDYQTILLTELLDICNKNKINRIPIIKSNHTLLNLIHRSMIDLVISKHALIGNTVKELTVKDLLLDIDTSAYLNKPQLSIREDATLIDAKSAYDNEPNAQDIFITNSGGISDPVVGWLTQNEIIKYLKQ